MCSPLCHTQTREKQKYETIFRLSGAKKEQHSSSSSKKEGGRDDIFLMGGRPSLSIFFFFLYAGQNRKKKKGRKKKWLTTARAERRPHIFEALLGVDQRRAKGREIIGSPMGGEDQVAPTRPDLGRH